MVNTLTVDNKKKMAPAQYLSRRRKELVARILILQDLYAEYRISLPARMKELEFQMNLICFEMPLANMMNELRFIDGPKRV